MSKIFFLLLLFSFVIQAQWQPDVRLTIDGALSTTALNNAWYVATFGNTVHTVWHDNRDGNVEVYYKRSSNGGLNWNTDTRLTNNVNLSSSPCLTISVSQSGVISVNVFWIDSRDGNYEIYYKNSTDAGLSWGVDVRLTNSTGDAFNPAVSVVNAIGQMLHLVWHDYRDGNAEIYYKRSTNGGISWGVDMRLTTNSGNSFTPTIAFSGSLVHTAWSEDRDGNYEIYYKRSVDGGLSWGADTRLTNQTAASQLTSVAVSGSVTHITWRDNRDGNTEVYYKRSTDAGLSWSSDTRLTNNSSISDYPSIAVSGSVVHISWDDQRDGNDEVYYKRSTDGGLSWTADTRLTNSAGVSDRPSVVISGQVAHMIWQDNRDGNYEIYYKLNPTGNVVGVMNINSDIPVDFSLSQNYPNPFNPTTNFEFQIADFGFVNLTIYDAMGRVIETLVNEELKPGTYKADWDASKFTSGVYFYRLKARVFTETKPMVFIK